MMNSRKWVPFPGGQRVEGHGEVHHVHGECHQYCLSHLYQNASTHGRWIHEHDDHYQVDSERGDMGELNMIMENVINIACRTFIKMPAPIEDEFTKMRTITRWTASRGTWGSPSWLWRMLSLLLVAPLSKCQHTWKMNLQKWGPLPGGQWVEGHGEVHHDHGEYYQNYLLLLFQNAGTQWRQFHINHYCMTSNLVPLILTLRMKFRMTFRSGHVQVALKTQKSKGVIHAFGTPPSLPSLSSL